MSEDKKAVAESKLSLSEEMHLGFLQSMAKTNTEKITREILERLSEDTGDSDSYCNIPKSQPGFETLNPPNSPLHFILLP
jgi:hypothetical protein